MLRTTLCQLGGPAQPLRFLLFIRGNQPQQVAVGLGLERATGIG